MKKVISAFFVMVFAAGMAFAADEAATQAQAAAESKAPVASAAVEVTKEAADVVDKGIERRQTRRQSRREALMGGGKEKKGTPISN